MSTQRTIRIEGKNRKVFVSDDQTAVDLSDTLTKRYRASRKVRAEVHNALAEFVPAGAGIFGNGEHLADL